MQNERFKIHFYKEGNVINKEGKHRILMKVRFEGKEIYRKAIGYLPEGNWESDTVVGRSLEAQEMRSILDQVHKEYFEAADFVVNHLGQKLNKTSLLRRLGKSKNRKDLRLSEAVDLYVEAHPNLSYHSKKGYVNFKKRIQEFGDCSATRFSQSVHQEFETWLYKTRPNIGSHSVKAYCQVASQAVINWLSTMDEFGRVINIWAFGNGPRYKSQVRGPNRNKALSPEQLEVYYNNLPSCPANPDKDPDLYEYFLHTHLWFLKFAFGGMNLTTYLFLKKEDYNFKTFTFQPQIRNKTGEIIHSFVVLEKARPLIVQIAAKSHTKELFPIVGDSKAVDAHIVNNYQQRANPSLKRYCTSLGIPAVTTYNCRSTFALIASQKGMPIEDIQRIMGHARMEQTREHIKRLPRKISMEGLI